MSYSPSINWYIGLSIGTLVLSIGTLVLSIRTLVYQLVPWPYHKPLAGVALMISKG